MRERGLQLILIQSRPVDADTIRTFKTSMNTPIAADNGIRNRTSSSFSAYTFRQFSSFIGRSFTTEKKDPKIIGTKSHIIPYERMKVIVENPRKIRLDIIQNSLDQSLVYHLR